MDVLLVFLGAGASYDCMAPRLGEEKVSTEDLDSPPDATLPGPFTWEEVRPPLTQSLVDTSRRMLRQVLGKHPGADTVVSHLREDLLRVADSRLQAPTLEASLARIRDQQLVPDEHLRSFQRYLRDALLECTAWTYSTTFSPEQRLYHRLVRECVRWAEQPGRELCFVSFNYDQLLERELERRLQSFRSDRIETYVGHEVSLLKPHGSAGWSIDLADHPDGRKPFAYMAGHARRREVPALVLPADGKGNFSEWTHRPWPPSQWKKFDDMASRSTRVLTIGWRASEEAIVGRLLKHARGRVNQIVNVLGPTNTAQDEIVKRGVEDALEPLRAWSGSTRTIVDDIGWVEWMAHGRLEEMLRAGDALMRQHP